MNYADGSIYEGEYSNGKRSGTGKLTKADGTVSHEGKWYDDKPQTKGSKQYPDGLYTGELVDGKKHGQGKFEYSDGTYHEGYFVDDKFQDGKGTVNYADGSVYVGGYIYGEKWG